MANNYTLFSDGLTLNSPEEIRWLQHQLEEATIYQMPGDKLLAVSVEEDEEPEGAIENLGDFPRFFAEVYPSSELKVCSPSMCCVDFEAAYNDVSFYTEDSGDPGPVAELVRLYLQKFAPDQWWSLNYAWTCDKPRTDEFGGGAVFVTAQEIKWFNGPDWVQAEVADFEHGLHKIDHWEGHPDYPVEAWIEEVANNDTRQGYMSWVRRQIEMDEHDKETDAKVPSK